ncbi:MAG: 3-deoxy-7-phosphoheptulonate synthase, partial [Chloroflexia bacterium]|nr:3-deoxy-7-phosphoheptulonate synthase [Chloroflexia bacterium]
MPNSHEDHQPQVANLHVREFQPLLAPLELKAQLPLRPEAAQTVTRARDTIRAVLRGEDQRLLVV